MMRWVGPTPVFHSGNSSDEEEREYFPLFFWERQVRWTGIVSWLLVPAQLLAIYELTAGFSLFDAFMMSYFLIAPFVLWCVLALLYTKGRRTNVGYRIGILLLVAVWFCPWAMKAFIAFVSRA